MRFSPILTFHIFAGTLGCLSGFVAVFLRKGSRQHGLAGNVFVVSMMGLATSGVYLAIMKSQPGNIIGGVLTFYLVTTAWMTARRGDGKTRIFDWGALLISLPLATALVTLAVEAAKSPTGRKYGYPIGVYLFLGSIAVLSAMGDIRLLVRGGISGTQRIARHLWRMCFAFFIAAGSIFLARQHLFPTILRKTRTLYLLTFMPLILMVFWLIRIRFKNVYEKKLSLSNERVPSLQT